jgi:hypothetical protein
MAGVMSHEVAHAYREFHGLVDGSSREHEEIMTDITAVYLGFGILVANNNFRVRTSGTNVGYAGTQSWSTTQVGYLNPQAFAFLLALQFVARAFTPDQCQRLLKHLEPDQAAFAKAAIDSIVSSSEKLLVHLKLPPTDSWPSPVPLSDILQPLPQFQISNAGRPVFRISRVHLGRYGLLGFFGGVVLSFLLTMLAPAFAEFVFIIPLIGLIGGIYWGSTRAYQVCSLPECGAVLAPETTICPNCEGTIVDVSEEAGSDKKHAKNAPAGKRKKKHRRN